MLLSGCVVEPPAVSGERERFVLELEPHARAQVTLYTKPDQALPALAYGERIEMEAKVRKPRNYGNPGAFDYVRYLARKHVYWTASGAAAGLHRLPDRCGDALAGAAMNLRAAALRRIETLWQPDAYRVGMMQAVLVGQQYQLRRVWTDDYRNTGTFHALVISGTHVAILAAFFLFLLRLCFVPEGAALAATAAMAWLYALVSGWGAPCVRSAAGLSIYAVGSYFYRDRRPLNLLAAVALGFLLFDPEQLFDASFQLTFLAVAFLGAFATPLIRATSRAPGARPGRAGATGGAIWTCRRAWRSSASRCGCWPKRCTRLLRLPERGARRRRGGGAGARAVFPYEVTADLRGDSGRAGASHGGLFPSRGLVGAVAPTHWWSR